MMENFQIARFHSQDSVSICQQNQIYSNIQQQMNLDSALARQLQDEYNGTTSTRGRNRGGARQQIMPRLQLLNDEDDGVTCRMCLQPFWYKSQLHDHLKSMHSITDPERYEKIQQMNLDRDLAKQLQDEYNGTTSTNDESLLPRKRY